MEEEGGGEVRRRPRVVLGLSGSVACVKAAELVGALSATHDVCVVATEAATHFVQGEALSAAGAQRVLLDEHEWRQWKRVGDPVEHIELRRWADAVLVAPLSANTLAKFAGGLCDNLLTCVLRAWDFSKPCIVAPAMNTHMWESPFTARHLATLRELGVEVVDPVAKTLACGDVGVGAMASVGTLADAVRGAVRPGRPV